MTNLTKNFAALALICGGLALSACANTVEGAGQDIQNAGDAIEQTAEETHDDDPTTP